MTDRVLDYLALEGLIGKLHAAVGVLQDMEPPMNDSTPEYYERREYVIGQISDHAKELFDKYHASFTDKSKTKG